MVRKFLRIFVNNGGSRHVCTTLDVATVCETCGPPLGRPQRQASSYDLGRDG
jgi:hypothetical protein